MRIFPSYEKLFFGSRNDEECGAQNIYELQPLIHSHLETYYDGKDQINVEI
jgi:hypothetical protein